MKKGMANRENEVIPREAGGPSEPNDHDAFAVLGSEVCAIDYALVDLVTQILKDIHDHLEGVPAIMRLEVLDILKNESIGRRGL